MDPPFSKSMAEFFDSASLVISTVVVFHQNERSKGLEVNLRFKNGVFRVKGRDLEDIFTKSM